MLKHLILPVDQDIAKAEKVSTQFVGPIMRLAYLSPDVLERLLLWREAPSATLLQMVEATYLPWSEQMGWVFECPRTKNGCFET